MKRPAVFIATTSGPVQVERVIRERAPLSLVMLGRSSKTIAISADYDDFVRPPSGPIERFFGPFPEGGFRLELSHPVDAGTSWQLAAFTAHAVAAADEVELARDIDDADGVIWLTGTVDYDGRVGRVGLIGDKLDSSAAAVFAWRQLGLPVIMAAPADDGPDRLAQFAGGHGARTIPVTDALQFCRQLGLTALRDRTAASLRAPRRRTAAMPGIALATGLAASTAAAAWLLFAPVPVPYITPFTAAGGASPPATTARPPVTRPPPMAAALPQPQVTPAAALTLVAGAITEAATPRVPVPGEPAVRIHERRAPPGSSCLTVHFANGTTVDRPVAMDASGQPAPSAADGLCGLSFVMDAGREPLFVRADLAIESGRIVGSPAAPAALTGATAVSGPQRWDIDLPARRFDGLSYRLEVHVDQAPFGGASAPPRRSGRGLILRHRIGD